MSDSIKTLNMSDPDFAEQLMDALGVKPGDTVQFSGPQFNRTDGVIPDIPDAWSKVPNLYAETLEAIGCKAWCKPDARGNQLWLFPAEWYPLIPAGFEVTTIRGKKEKFEPGRTSDDRRFGALAYGVTININEQPGAV